MLLPKKDGQSAKHFGGTGLGLAISRKLTEIMNGKLTVQSEIDKGSTFYVKLHNVSVGSAIVEEDDKKAYEELQSYKFDFANILLVDDVEENRILVSNYLRNYGFNIIEAENGADAIRLSHKNIDLVLMDIKMPIMNGYDATEKIKKEPSTSNIPILALTASVGDKPELDEKNKIFDDFLSKPIDRKTLISALAKFLKHTKESTSTVVIKENEIVLKGVNKEEFVEQFFSYYNNIYEKGDLDLIVNFATEVVDFAKKHSDEELESYANNIINYANAFDIENVEKLMSNFEKFFK